MSGPYQLAPGRARAYPAKRGAAQKGLKIIGGAANLCDLWHTSTEQDHFLTFPSCADIQRLLQ
jgi:hypothetical protein